MKAYCFKCRTIREMENEERFTMKNGKPAVRGKCAMCGTSMVRISKAN